MLLLLRSGLRGWLLFLILREVSTVPDGMGSGAGEQLCAFAYFGCVPTRIL